LGWRLTYREDGRAAGVPPWQLATHMGVQDYIGLAEVAWAIREAMICAWMCGVESERVVNILEAPMHPQHEAAWAWYRTRDPYEDHVGRRLACADPFVFEERVPTDWTARDRERLFVDFEWHGCLLRAVDWQRAKRAAKAIAAVLGAPRLCACHPRL
jgi:hypothetical protein